MVLYCHVKIQAIVNLPCGFFHSGNCPCYCLHWLSLLINFLLACVPLAYVQINLLTFVTLAFVPRPLSQPVSPGAGQLPSPMPVQLPNPWSGQPPPLIRPASKSFIKPAFKSLIWPASKSFVKPASKLYGRPASESFQLASNVDPATKSNC